MRGKQKEGNLVIGSVTDQATDVGLGDQEVLAYRCDTRTHPDHASATPIGDGHHPVDAGSTGSRSPR